MILWRRRGNVKGSTEGRNRQHFMGSGGHHPEKQVASPMVRLEEKKKKKKIDTKNTSTLI
jgi:hypothetical protein